MGLKYQSLRHHPYWLRFRQHSASLISAMPKLKSAAIWPQPAKVELTTKEIEEIASSPLSYGQVKEKYGEEVAIDVGIARDPDTWEWTDSDFARARPASIAVPHIIERWR